MAPRNISRALAIKLYSILHCYNVSNKEWLVIFCLFVCCCLSFGWLVSWLVRWLVGWLVRSFVRSLLGGLVGFMLFKLAF